MALFVPGWFVPFSLDKIPPLVFILGLFAFDGHFSETAPMVGVFVVLFGVPAIAVGWVLQCLYVVLTTNRKRGGG